MRSILAHSFADCANELLVGPIADAAFWIGGNVARVNGAKRQFEGKSTGKGATAARHRVTGNAICGSGEIFAARDRVGVRRRSGNRWRHTRRNFSAAE